jgi:WD40 repeat protein
MTKSKQSEAAGGMVKALTPAGVVSGGPAGGPVGGQLTQRPGAVSPDGKRLYLCSGDAVRSFCTATGAPLGPPLLGHIAAVTAVAFHPGVPSGTVLVTASLDGTLRTWNAVDGTQTSVLAAPGGAAVESMVAPGGKCAKGSDTVFISCWKGTNGGGAAEGETGAAAAAAAGCGRIHAYSLKKGCSVERIIKTAAPPTLACSPSGTFLGAFERHTVLVWPLERKEGGGRA